MNASSDQRLCLVLNVPNVITAIRICLTGVIIWLLLEHSFFTAGILIIIAAITDGLDGFLARRLQQTSPGGVLFDLVADEIFFIPCLITAIVVGLFSRTDGLMPFNPYLYAVPALAGGFTVIAGVVIYLWKRRKRTFEFPSPTGVAKVNFWFWLAPLIVAVFGIGPDIVLAVLMYLALISTLFTFYSYLKKGSYVFTE